MNPAFLREAIRLAIANVQWNEGGPFGAVVVREQQIVGTGWNRVTSTNDPTAHAEVIAIRDACTRLATFNLAGCELYCSCQPCPMCLASAYWARLDRVFYAADSEDAAAAGFDDSIFYRELAKPPAERSMPMTQALRDEAVLAFDTWVQRDDRTAY